MQSSFSYFSEGMPPPVTTLTRQWKKIKKRCSFSSSDRQLVRSRSFTEQDPAEPNITREETDGDGGEGLKYLTLGDQDLGKFHSLRTRLGQTWNSEARKQRQSRDSDARSRLLEDDGMFVVASPRTGNNEVRSALVVSSSSSNSSNTSYSTQSLRPRSRPTRWSSPSPSCDGSDQDSQAKSCHSQSYQQDQDSGYEGFCPEKSIYSTGSSDTSSVLSSEECESRPRLPSLYTRPPDLPSPLHESTPKPRTLPSPRAQISQATVVSLPRTPRRPSASGPGDTPPPLPPRPSPQSLLPPLPLPRPRSSLQAGASLPRRKIDFREAARRRTSCQEPPNRELQKKSEPATDLDGKVGRHRVELQLLIDFAN